MLQFEIDRKRDNSAVCAPLLLLLKGHPGSGKSTIAKLLATECRFVLCDKDDSRDCLKAAQEQYGSPGAWDLNALSYEIMFTVAATQLSCGQSVVVDCPLSNVNLYQQALAIADKVQHKSLRAASAQCARKTVPLTNQMAAVQRISCSS